MMNKKAGFFLVIILTMLVFGSLTVHAAEDKGGFKSFIEAINKLGLEPAALLIASNGVLTEPGFAFMRFCMGIIIFSLFFFVLKKQFTDHKNIAVAISLVAATISALGTPKEWLQMIFSIGGAIGLLIIFLGFMVMCYKLQKSVEDNNFLAGLITILTAIVLYGLLLVIGKIIEIVVPEFGWIEGILWIIIFFYVIAGIFKIASGGFNMGAAATSNSFKTSADAVKDMKDSYKKVKDVVTGEDKEKKKMDAQAQQLIKDIDSINNIQMDKDSHILTNLNSLKTYLNQPDVASVFGKNKDQISEAIINTLKKILSEEHSIEKLSKSVSERINVLDAITASSIHLTNKERDLIVQEIKRRRGTRRRPSQSDWTIVEANKQNELYRQIRIGITTLRTQLTIVTNLEKNARDRLAEALHKAESKKIADITPALDISIRAKTQEINNLPNVQRELQRLADLENTEYNLGVLGRGLP